MKKTLPIGVMNYERIKLNNYYHVDKTLMIKEFLEKQVMVTLITRPRRFGKTLNMSMMARFFDITKDSRLLFKGTKVMNSECAHEINQYPTLYLSFASAKNDKVSIVKAIKQEIIKEYQSYQPVLEDLDEFEMVVYRDIKSGLFDLNNGNMNDISESLSFLMEKLEKYYHKKVMLFIDEYDTPFIEAHVRGFYEEINGGLSSLLHNTLKLSSSLQYAMLTGIQRMVKESIFSGLNNLMVCSVGDDEYAEYFGFSEDETKLLLNYYGLELNLDVKKMYDGYKMGSVNIYNPWSIINYAFKKKLEPYWVNTSGNMMIKEAMKQSDSSFKDEFETLIKMGFLETQIEMGTSFYEKSSTASLWGLFINAGYLTINKKIESNRYSINIPNDEVKEEFKDLIADYLSVPISNCF